jgi:hypothetical protein
MSLSEKNLEINCMSHEDFKHPEEEIINLQKNIDQVNLILESLRKGRQAG